MRRRTKARLCVVCMCVCVSVCMRCEGGVKQENSRVLASYNIVIVHIITTLCWLCPPPFTPDRPHSPSTAKPGNLLQERAGIVALGCV